MKYVVLMSHGHLASGMKSTVELIAGANERLKAFDAYVDGHGDIHSFLGEFLEKHKEDEVIAVTDILGGSVNNDALTYNQRQQLYIVAGMNVPLVLNLVLKLDSDMDTVEMIRESIQESQELLTYCEKTQAEEDEEF